jgi:ElaB/YqjD/DUF883 family membrane-anchored ribosome-binding protein
MDEQGAMENDMTFGKLMQDFKVVVHDAESLCKATASDLGDKAREARARLATSLESAKAIFARLRRRQPRARARPTRPSAHIPTNRWGWLSASDCWWACS